MKYYLSLKKVKQQDVKEMYGNFTMIPIEHGVHDSDWDVIEAKMPYDLIMKLKVKSAIKMLEANVDPEQIIASFLMPIGFNEKAMKKIPGAEIVVKDENKK